MEPHSLYIHIPFCVHRCAYCDFNTYAGMENLIPEYIGALCKEISWVGSSAGARIPVHTIFFGGGTPSLLPLSGLELIFRAIHDQYDLLPGVEVTLEANPGSLKLDFLKSLKVLGINRLSLGVQSANVEELKLLERIHSVPEVIRSVVWARQAGFDNLNLDLIFGLPAQALSTWKKSLDFALGLHPDHISLYALTLEHGTPMRHWVDRGLMVEPDPDMAAEMYEQAGEVLDKAGFRQYEISNWARESGGSDVLACRHNLQYWRGKPYIGVGAGAHGYVQHSRTANVLSPAAYIRRMTDATEIYPEDYPRSPATENFTHLSVDSEIAEYMMMGLRLTHEGVPNVEFANRFGKSLIEAFGLQIEQLVRKGLLEWIDGVGSGIRLTKAGRLLGNQVFVEFI